MCFLQINNIEMQEQTFQRKSRQYSRVNCCSQGVSVSQVLAIALILAVQIINFNLLPHMIRLKSEAMHFLIGLYFLSLIILSVQYIRLLVIDPSDPRLQDPNYQSPPEVQQKQCEACECRVASSSYHCQSCQRCVEEFDHHCTFVNNCIGKNNYSIFIQLLISFIVHTSTGIGIATWLLLALQNDFKWLALVFGAIHLAIFLQITVLALFHCYISFVLYKTTLQVLRGRENEAKGREIQRGLGQAPEQTNINFAKVSPLQGSVQK